MSGLISAWAAAAAAVASLATLLVTTIVTGRREHRRWKRESLTEVFVSFLDASWCSSDAVRDARRAKTEGRTAEAAARLVEGRNAYEAMRSQLTRLRLQACDNVTSSGHDLLR